MKSIPLDPKLKHSLYSRVIIYDDIKCCWSWTGRINSIGYGNLEYKGEVYYSHRIAYAFHNKISEFELEVMHSCDNKICCNPYHLLLGTQDQNILDAMIKNRHVKGNTHGMTKYSEEVVKQIRLDYQNGMSINDLMIKYGISKYIYRILNNQWRKNG
jgi:hypothetical protein